MAHLPDAAWRQRPGLDGLFAAMGAGSGETRYVGGAVRDGLLGLDVADIDLATVHRPEETMRRLERAGIKAVPTGLAHGTVTAVVDRRPVEITTLRCDVSTDGRRATVAYTDDWQQDAARRDFTINALYADVADGAIEDYFGGVDDLAARRVRFIGDPSARIAEDHLRILRYFRFLARFGGDAPDAAAYAACVDKANSLMALSRERIADELMKLLALPDPTQVLALMVEGGIWRPVLPEMAADGIERLRCLIERELRAGLLPGPALRLAALLPPDADTGERVAARLKLSNKVRKRIVSALTPPPPHKSPEELAFRLGTEAAGDVLLLDDARDVTDAARIAHWPVPHLPLGGGDLVEMGLTRGPDIARALGEVREQWIAQGFPGETETRALAAQIVSKFQRASQ